MNPEINLLKKANHQHHPVVFTAQGNSMLPLIYDSEKVTLIPKNFSQINTYDIVVYYVSDQIVVHQCLFKNKHYLVTKGLNNNFLDPPVSPRQILGIIKNKNSWQLMSLAYQLEFNQIKKMLPAHIKLVILKGSPWQKQLYGYFLNKPLSDLDLLVKLQDYPQIQKILPQLGYHLSSPSTTTSVSEITFIKNTPFGQFAIDIHFNAIRSALNPIFKYPLTPINCQKLTAYFFSVTVKKPDGCYYLKNEDLLLYLCANATLHHAVRNLDILANCAHVISTQKINWSNFWHHASRYHLSFFVYYPLVWTVLLFGIKIPDLKHHKPQTFRHFLMKILVNHYTIFQPYTRLSQDHLSGRLNVYLIFLIRAILYER